MNSCRGFDDRVRVANMRIEHAYTYIHLYISVCVIRKVLENGIENVSSVIHPRRDVLVE